MGEQDASLAFQRLHALVRGGYKARLGTQTVDSAIDLDPRGKAPPLRLFPDGSIRVLDKKMPVHAEGPDRFTIEAEDETSYRRLAAMIEDLRLRRRGRWRRRLFPF
ncbi:MAG: hypothetical protein ACXWUN_07520 [Allosphingosinicella sp.]